MIYDNSQMRRQDRIMSEERALELLKTAEYGVLSMINTDGKPYSVPLNFVFDQKNSIYFHCATEGKKLRALEMNPEVSFCIIGKVQLQPEKIGTLYESVVVQGVATTKLSANERMEALDLIVKKLSPDFYEKGIRYAEKAFPNTAVIRLDINTFSGKSKSM